MARIKGTTAEQTRERIIGAALELFAERTFAGTSLRDIAERLSLTKSAVYYHFESKDALLDAILAPMTDGLQDLFSATIKARADLDPADTDGSDAFKVHTIRALVALQLAHLPLLRALIFDPSAMRKMSERRPFMGFDDEFESTFGGSDDPGVRLRHRCALGAINGGLLLTVRAQRRDAEAGVAAPCCGVEDAEATESAFAQILVGAACSVLGLDPGR